MSNKYKSSIQNVSNISTKQKKEKKTSPKEVEQNMNEWLLEKHLGFKIY